MKKEFSVAAAPGSFPGLKAEVFRHHIWGVHSNALVLRLEDMRPTLSGLMGYRRARLVCNCYAPAGLWPQVESGAHRYEDYMEDVLKAISDYYQIERRSISALSTGVDIDDMAFAHETYGDPWVRAWVTAGFGHNALRIGVEPAHGFEVNGRYQPCGTINIIVASSARMSLGTMASSFITITEAKGVALQDLAIHSTAVPSLQATGTGTDQIVVISGDGARCRYVGGHTKLGELMARAVIRATKTACQTQLAKDPNYYNEVGK